MNKKTAETLQTYSVMRVPVKSTQTALLSNLMLTESILTLPPAVRLGAEPSKSGCGTLALSCVSSE